MSWLPCSDCPLPAALSWQSRAGNPVLSVLFCLPCSGCPFCLSRSSCSVLNVPFCPSSPFCLALAVLSKQSCAGSPVLAVLSCSGFPILLVLPWLSNLCSPVVAALSWQSFSACPVPAASPFCPLFAVLYWQPGFACQVLPIRYCLSFSVSVHFPLSCSACQVLPAQFCLCVLVVLSFRSCPGCLLAVLSWQPCPGCPVLELLSFSSCPVPAVLYSVFSWLSCLGCLKLAALFWLSSFVCPVLPFLICLSLSACTFLPVYHSSLSWQSCSGRPVLPVQLCLSGSAGSVSPVRSFRSCPGCLILAVLLPVLFCLSSFICPLWLLFPVCPLLRVCIYAYMIYNTHEREKKTRSVIFKVHKKSANAQAREGFTRSAKTQKVPKLLHQVAVWTLFFNIFFPGYSSTSLVVGVFSLLSSCLFTAVLADLSRLHCRTL